MHQFCMATRTCGCLSVGAQGLHAHFYVRKQVAASMLVMDALISMQEPGHVVSCNASCTAGGACDAAVKSCMTINSADGATHLQTHFLPPASDSKA